MYGYVVCMDNVRCLIHNATNYTQEPRTSVYTNICSMYIKYIGHLRFHEGRDDHDFQNEDRTH